METAREIYIALFICAYVAVFVYFVVRQWPGRPEEGWGWAWHTFTEGTLAWLGTPILIAMTVGALGLLLGWF